MTGRLRSATRGQWRAAIWSGLACAALSLPAHPASQPDGRTRVEVAEAFRTWPVDGDDLAGLRDAIASHAGAEGPGEGHGRTRTTLQISYDARRVDGGCRAEDMAIRATITTTLPAWAGRTTAAHELAARWDRSRAALARHESTHRRHALEAIERLRTRLDGIGTMRDCTALRREVYRHRLAVTTRWAWRDARYDRRTRNGLEEGTRL